MMCAFKKPAPIAKQFSRAEGRATPRCGLSCSAVEAPPVYTFTQLPLRIVCENNLDSPDSGKKLIGSIPRIANAKV
jgi:hypothetical protein